MDKENFANRYFNDEYHYISPYRLEQPFKDGDFYNYVSHTVLDGVINYVTPIKIFLLDRYTTDLEKRQQLLNKFHNEPETHTSFSMLEDDVLILAHEDDSNYYWFFWSDCDCSDCEIGRFKTTDSREEVIESFTEWVKGRQINYCSKYHPEREGKVEEVDCSKVRGWVSF